MPMCAIAGVLGLPVDKAVIDRLLSTMARRGPDGMGIYQQPGNCMLHTRLAIIDPAGGAQPMVLAAEGERYILTYNGELYNTEELRRELQALGHDFLGHSDTEVVLHAYVQWKEGCVDRFNGIFAFAVLEEGSGKVFLARDRIGVKPLFYKCHEGGLLFASEIKTILTYPTVQAQLDLEGGAQIVMLGPGRIPGKTPFHNIQEIEPGHYGVYQAGKMTLRRYWALRDRAHSQSFEETSARVRFLVLDAIHRQMVSDVPIGCFLSGGLDSSIISAVCARQMPQIHTFSVDNLGNDRYFKASKFQPSDDRTYIQLMEQWIDCRHHWVVLSPEELLNALEAATQARDLPGMADVDFSLLAFCGRIRPFVKVALSGECADEIFGGYPWFRDPAVRNVDGFPWAQNTADRVALMHPDLRAKIDGHAFVQDLYRDTIREADILPGTPPLERRMKEMMHLNFRWFMQTLLDRKDRMSMYHGLEVRVPFCDHRIAEYLYSVPWSYKDYQGREKGLLRNAMQGLLPEQVLYRKKSPYPKTHHPGYLALVRKRVERLLEDQSAPLFYLFDREAVVRLLDADPAWPWYGQLMTLPQTLAYLLQVEYWLECYNLAWI